jgi:hypothetical protein
MKTDQQTGYAIDRKSSAEIWKEYIFREQDLRNPMQSNVSRILHRIRVFIDFNKTSWFHFHFASVNSGVYSDDASYVLFWLASDPDISILDVIDAVRYYNANANQIIEGTSFLNRLAETSTSRALNVLYFVLSHCQISDSLIYDQKCRNLLILICIFPGSSNVCVLQEKIIQLLLSKYCTRSQINRLDSENCSALFYAWKNRKTSIMKYLLEKNASVLSCADAFVSWSDGLSILSKFTNDFDEMFLTEFVEKNVSVLNRVVDYHSLSRSYWTHTPEELERQSNGMILFRALEEIKEKIDSSSRKAGTVNEKDNSFQTDISFIRRTNKQKKLLSVL